MYITSPDFKIAAKSTTCISASQCPQIMGNTPSAQSLPPAPGPRLCRHPLTRIPCESCNQDENSFTFQILGSVRLNVEVDQTIRTDKDKDGEGIGPRLLISGPSSIRPPLRARARIIGCVDKGKEDYCSPTRWQDPHVHSLALSSDYPVEYVVELTPAEVADFAGEPAPERWYGIAGFDQLVFRRPGVYFLGFDVEEPRGRLRAWTGWYEKIRATVRPRKLTEGERRWWKDDDED